MARLVAVSTCRTPAVLADLACTAPRPRWCCDPDARRLLVADLRRSSGSNSLVLIVPAWLNLPVQRLSDLTRPVVQRKPVLVDAVRIVLALVGAGDGEAGLAYSSGVAAAAASPGRVRVVATLAAATPIRCPAKVAVGSQQPELARDFITHLRGEPARAVFKRFGFGLT